ncbi:hypothetical protein V8I69_003929 [Salmonella enterica]
MTIQIPESPAPVICQSRAIHPWDQEHGHRTPDGSYISPVNALKALAGAVADADGKDIIITMICASDAAEFARRLNNLADVLPLPAVTQVARRAKAQISQALDRMQIPATPLNSMPPPAPLIMSTLNGALNSTRVKQAAQDALTAASPAAGDVKAALTAFRQQRQQFQQDAEKKLTELTGKTAEVFAFIHHAGSAEPAIVAMMKNIPSPSSSLAYAHLFTGDLAGMKEWFKGAQ